MRRFLIILLVGFWAAGALFAQPTSPPPVAGRAAPTLPPVPAAPPRSPVDFFRQMIAMPPAERDTELARRSAPSRDFLEKKLKEFDALSPGVREARLQTLQLRWHLLPLMKMAPDQRAPRLATMPDADRGLVGERLEQWDGLPAELQQKVLENEPMMRVFFGETNAPSAELAPPNLSAKQREQREQDLLRWNALPLPERERIHEQFNRLFHLSEKEKDKILKRMSDTERLQMQRALQTFGRLPEKQREVCLRNFQKFAALPPEERQEFLVNAERWQRLDPKDRQSWRDLVARLQPKPPLPPGLRSGPPLPPPPGLAPKPPPSTGTVRVTN